MLPQPTLGEINAFTISTPDLENSLKFYELLGFKEVMRLDFPFPWIQVSDGAVLIMLRKDPEPYLALTYYVDDMEKSVAEVENAGIEFTQRPAPDAIIIRFVFQSPDKLNISLVTKADGFAQPPGPTMLRTSPDDFFTPAKYTNQTIGMFGELAHSVTDLDTSIAFWEKLGFTFVSKYQHPYPWAIVSDGLAVVGLHQTDSFDKPALTFFASDMKEKIESLKANGLTDYTEMGPANIVVTSPEGQRINLFKLGM